MCQVLFKIQNRAPSDEKIFKKCILMRLLPHQGAFPVSPKRFSKNQLKIGSAFKVEHRDNVARTNIYTFAAAYAFFSVDSCKKTVHMYCIMLTCFFASPTPYTTYLANFICKIALIFIAAMHYSLFFDRQKRYQMFRAGFHAHAAGNAAFRLYHSNAVADAERSVLTCVNAVAEAYAAVKAARRASGNLCRRRARIYTFIIDFIGSVVTTAPAAYHRFMRFGVNCADSKVF